MKNLKVAVVIQLLFVVNHILAQSPACWQRHQTMAKELPEHSIATILSARASMYLGIVADNGYSLSDALLQKHEYSPGLINTLNGLAIKNIAFQHTSVLGDYIVEIDTVTYEILGTPWTGFTGVGKRVWYGFKAFYDGEPWMKYASWSDFFSEKWQYPDGSEVSDAYGLAAKGIDGTKNLWFFNFDANGDTLNRQYQMDICSPYLPEYKKEELKILIDEGIDGFWFDEYDIDNMLVGGATGAGFGDWTRVVFREYLSKNFSPTEISQMGISDPNTFDILTYMKNRGLPYDSDEWQKDLVWLAFVKFKTDSKVRFNHELIEFAKNYGQSIGKEIAILGNAWPLHPNAGESHAELDIPFHELNMTRYLAPGGPVDFPPSGKQQSAIAKLSTGLSGANYAFFVPREYPSALQNRPGLYEIQMAEMIGNRGIYDYSHDVLFPLNKVGEIYGFIHDNQSLFDDRQPYADLGLVFSPRSNSALTTPYEPGAWAPGPKQNIEFLGWAKALTEFHIQWATLASYDINAINLARFRVIILPTTLVLSDTDVSEFEQFVNAGGMLIVVGEASSRDHRLWPRVDYALSGLTGVHIGNEPDESLVDFGLGRVAYIKDLVGTLFHLYEDKNSKDRIGNVLDSVLPTRLVETNASDLIGINLYWQENAERLLVNFNNYNIDVASDAITPAESIRVKVKLPDKLIGKTLYIFASSWDLPLTRLPVNQIEEDGVEFILSNLRAFAVVEISPNDQPTSVESDIGILTSFDLSPNYPNPFNPETNIAYQLPKSTEVKLEIYNIIGQKITTLVNANKDPGYYLAKWNGKDNSGADVASGLYFYRLQTKEFIKSRKLILLR